MEKLCCCLQMNGKGQIHIGNCGFWFTVPKTIFLVNVEAPKQFLRVYISRHTVFGSSGFPKTEAVRQRVKFHGCLIEK